MPTRTFDKLDLINVTNGFVTGPSGEVNIAAFNVLFTDAVTASAAAAGADASAVVAGTWNYNIQADVDFTIFPTIPTNARITNIVTTYRYKSHVTGSATASVFGATCELNVAIPATDAQLALLPILDTSTINPVSMDWGDGSIHSTVITLGPTELNLLFGHPYATYSEFISTFGLYLVGFSGDSIIASTGTPGAASLTYDFAITDWNMVVTYVEFFQYTINTPGPVSPGDTIDITSPNNDTGLDFTHVTQSISYTDLDSNTQTIEVTTDVTLDAHHKVLLIPELPRIDPAFPITVIVTGDGTQFSGSVPLGTLAVLLTTASGIYKLVTGKTDDTIYDNNNQPATVDVAIPSPFFKTGYIGG